MRFDPQSNLVSGDLAVSGAGRRGGRSAALSTFLTGVGTFVIAVVIVGVWLWRASGLGSVAAAAEVLSVALPSPAEAAPVAVAPSFENRRDPFLVAAPAQAPVRRLARETARPAPAIEPVTTCDPLRKSAEQDFERAYDSGRSSLSVGRHAAAIEALEVAVHLRPGHADARYKLGLAHMATGNRRAAQEQSDALRKLNPSLANLLANLVTRPSRRTG